MVTRMCILIREVFLYKGNQLAQPKKKGPKNVLLLVRYSYLQDSYIEVLLYNTAVLAEQK
jgi:hypothetical protein